MRDLAFFDTNNQFFFCHRLLCGRSNDSYDKAEIYFSWGKIKMQASEKNKRFSEGRRQSTDRRQNELRSGDERRDEIGRRQNLVDNIEPDNRSLDERRTKQQRTEARRKSIRRSQRDRRDLSAPA